MRNYLFGECYICINHHQCSISKALQSSTNWGIWQCIVYSLVWFKRNFKKANGFTAISKLTINPILGIDWHGSTIFQNAVPTQIISNYQCWYLSYYCIWHIKALICWRILGFIWVKPCQNSTGGNAIGPSPRYQVFVLLGTLIYQSWKKSGWKVLQCWVMMSYDELWWVMMSYDELWIVTSSLTDKNQLLKIDPMGLDGK